MHTIGAIARKDTGFEVAAHGLHKQEDMSRTVAIQRQVLRFETHFENQTPITVQVVKTETSYQTIEDPKEPKSARPAISEEAFQAMSMGPAGNIAGGTTLIAGLVERAGGGGELTDNCVDYALDLLLKADPS